MERVQYKGYVIDPRVLPLKDGGFGAEVYIEEHTGPGVNIKKFFFENTFYESDARGNSYRLGVPGRGATLSRSSLYKRRRSYAASTSRSRKSSQSHRHARTSGGFSRRARALGHARQRHICAGCTPSRRRPPGHRRRARRRVRPLHAGAPSAHSRSRRYCPAGPRRGTRPSWHLRRPRRRADARGLQVPCAYPAGHRRR